MPNRSLSEQRSSDDFSERASNVTGSIAESGSSDGSDDLDDNILRQHALTGFQTLLMVQFEVESKAFIIVGIYFTYIISMLDIALVLAKRDTALLEGWTNVKGKMQSRKNRIEFWLLLRFRVFK